MSGTILRTLKVRLEADAAKLTEGLDLSVEKVSRAGERMVSVGRTLTAGLTLPLAAIGTASVKMAVDAEESANKFNVVMGAAADETRQKLELLTQTIPMTRQEMEAMAAGVQDMLVPMGVARDQAAGMSVDMVRLAGDLASFNNVGTDEVLMAIQSALAGSSEPMRRFGVDTRVTALEAHALKAGLIEEGEALDNTSTALAVLMAIQNDSTDAMGDAARTVDSTANQMRFLWAEVQQLGLAIGDILIPVVTPLIAHLRDLVGRFNDLSPKTQRVIVLVGGLAAALGPLLVVFGGLLAILPQVTAGIAIVGAAIGSPFLVPIAAAVAAIGTIIAIGVEVIEHWDVLSYEAGRLVDNVATFFRDMSSNIRTTVSEMVERIREFFVGGFTRIVDSVSAQIDRVRGFFSGLADVLVGHSIIPDMVRDIGTEFDLMGQHMITATDTATAGVVGGFEDMGVGVTDTVTETSGAVMGEFGNMNEDIIGETENLVSSVGDLFNQFGIDLPDSVNKTVGDISTAWGKIKAAIEVPSGEVLGKSLSDWKDWAVSIVNIVKSIWDKIGKIINKMTSAFQFGGGAITLGGMGGIGGSGGGYPGGVVITPGMNNGGGGTSADWERSWGYMEVANQLLEAIRDNTAPLRAMGGLGTNTSSAMGINESLEYLAARESRAAGWVEFA